MTARLFALLVAIAAGACGGAPLRVAALSDVERVRGTEGAKEGAALAPEAYARAEQERDLALRSYASGDQIAATLHAERAIAGYQHALVVARLARATAEIADAQKSLDDASTQQQALDTSRAKLEQDAMELEKRVQVARERLLPAPSASASAERAAARLLAARSLAVEARLLCGAARLVAADAVGLVDVEGELAKVDQQLGARPPASAHQEPIDDAARARAHCLDVLTRARRTAGNDAGRDDMLLSELSATGGWDPARDERGVVVTLRGLFRGTQLADEGAGRLKELGRVAGAHPGFAVQVVVHDAQQPPPKDDSDARRADAAVQALVAGGASPSRVKAELAGARAPIADPHDAKVRSRNERLDIVFVAAGSH
jgi:flagellar motor protein MotB